MKLAGIQISAGSDIERNIRRALELADAAIEKGARVIGFPELCFLPWFPRDEDEARKTFAVGTDHEHLSRFADASAKAQAVFVVPFFESANGAGYNSTAVFDCGACVGVYRKMHVPDLPLYREQFYFSRGDAGFPVFTTSQGRIGVQICWDNLFPEGSRILALKGADVIFAPTASSLDTRELWERAILANAFANNVFIFRVNRTGGEEGLAFHGRSFCAGPWGDTVSELAGSKEAVVLAEIDPDERKAALETWGFLKHRRPGEYKDLVKE
jgi:N-carbamoylputrescine amidase